VSAVIELDRLTKRYGSARGIEDVTMTVEGGEVFGFLGPNLDSRFISSVEPFGVCGYRAGKL
jgi:ABC-type lipopolysaccharide export system ATPase subunit